jgi:hypothetical protein
MRTPRDRRERTPVDFYPEEQECPACQYTVKARDHQQRWVMRLDQHVNVVRHVLEGGNTACTRQAVVDRPPQEEALAWRGSSCGLEVVARLGAWRYRPNWSITKMRAPRQTESPRAISLKEVAWRCEVFWAWVPAVAQHDEALLGPLSTLDGLVLAIDGVQPAKSHDTLDMLRDGCAGRVFVAKTPLSSATGAMAALIDEGLS